MEEEDHGGTGTGQVDSGSGEGHGHVESDIDLRGTAPDHTQTVVDQVETDADRGKRADGQGETSAC